MNVLIIEDEKIIREYSSGEDVNLVFLFETNYILSVKTTPARTTLIITVSKRKPQRKPQ